MVGVFDFFAFIFEMCRDCMFIFVWLFFKKKNYGGKEMYLKLTVNSFERTNKFKFFFFLKLAYYIHVSFCEREQQDSNRRIDVQLLNKL